MRGNAESLACEAEVLLGSCFHADGVKLNAHGRGQHLTHALDICLELRSLSNDRAVGIYYTVAIIAQQSNNSFQQFNAVCTYRKLVGAVFQDMMVMATSVAENIACEKQEDIDEQKLRQAMRLADIEEKICSLPRKEKTSVTNFLDKDGVSFSGGELQRILLARALYKDAPLLLLDEPTSALDPLAETAVYEQYHRLSQGKTTIFISHRLASTKFCDRIIYYENGQVKEDGTHDELMKENGTYAGMFEIQSQYYNEKGGDSDE